MIKLAIASALTLLALRLSQATPAPADDTRQATHCTFWHCANDGEDYPTQAVCKSVCGGLEFCSAVNICL